jgi:TPR repeat protein
MVGAFYELGFGAPIGAKKAFYWKEMAANLGYADAMCGMGFYYSEGIGCAKSEDKAFTWYKKAAEAGHPTAALLLAQCFVHAVGTPSNEAEALRWFIEAGERAAPMAHHWLAGIYERGLHGAQIDQKKLPITANSPMPEAQVTGSFLSADSPGVDLRWFKISSKADAAALGRRRLDISKLNRQI